MEQDFHDYTIYQLASLAGFSGYLRALFNTSHTLRENWNRSGRIFRPDLFRNNLKNPGGIY